MTEPRTLPRLMVAVPIGLVLGTVALVAASLIGWSTDVDASPVERVWGDRWLLTTSAVAGGATGAMLTWAVTTRTVILLGGGLLGVVPALVMASAFFTGAY